MGIVQHAKDISELVKKYNDQELYEKIVALREEILEIRAENLQLREENKTLKDNSQINEDLVRPENSNCYYRKDDTGRHQPYCMPCWDYDRKLVNLLQGQSSYDGSGTITCKICDARTHKP